MEQTGLIQLIGLLKETSLPNCPTSPVTSIIMSVCLSVSLLCDNMLLKVRDVRTNDDTLITVKLMVFYELRDVETMVMCVCTCDILKCQ